MKTNASSLADKLKALGVKTGNALRPPPKPDSVSIDSIVAGTFLPTPRGEVFVAEQTFPLDHQYG
ncbi:MAG: hypothetical protein L6Q26_13320, partial [Anaerolineales bacterium]|nr:hypothetical protein [Anaerolineales bacterium]